MKITHNKPAKRTSTRIKKILLTRNYRQFFFPSLIAAIALSLSEFVDSIVVSNLLDTQALSIVNVCMPLMTFMAAVYLMLSVGGVVQYTKRRGKSDTYGADSIFTISFVTALTIGIILLIFGQLFVYSIGNLLCPGLILGENLISYIRILLCSMPVLISVSLTLYFLTAAGNPKLSMALNIFANVLNLLLDYIYIKLFKMGVSGAAAATLTSYFATGILILLFKKRYDLHLVRFSIKDVRCLSKIFKNGLASSLSQISFTVKFAFCNSVAASLGGSSALAAMSLCVQTISIISIVIAGASDTIRPFLSLLRTQHDYDGTGYILKKTLRIVAVASVVFVVILELFPNIITTIYNVTSSQVLSVAIPALRIVGICYLFRSVCIIFMNYTSILGITSYATYISLFDGFMGIVAIGFVLSRLFRLTGLWLTYPVNAFLLLCSIILINIILQKKHPDRFTGLLLMEKDAPDVHTLDFSIDDSNKSISRLSEEATAFCEQNGLPKKLSFRIGLISEEMAIYIRRHIKSHELLNMLLQKKGDNLWLYFRSIGEPFDLSSFTREDIPENYKLLESLVPDYQYNYTIGMNNLRIKFDIGKELK
jgi:Na+-driven multidrug efflux pump